MSYITGFGGYFWGTLFGGSSQSYSSRKTFTSTWESTGTCRTAPDMARRSGMFSSTCSRGLT